MLKHRESSVAVPRPRASALSVLLAFVAVASALALSGSAYADSGQRTADSGQLLAQDGTVTSPENEDRNNDGFRDEDPSQPWPLFVIAGFLVIAAIAATVKLFRG